MAEAFATSSSLAWYEVRRLLAAITTLEVMVLVAIMFAASVPSQGWAAVATNTTATTEDLDASPSAGQDSGRRRGRGRRRRKLYHVDVTEAGEPCTPSPLWDRVVDPANYDYGCKEIQSMLAGNITLVGNGRVRDVYLVEYEGRKVALKTLRNMDDSRSQRVHLDKHKREILTLDVMRGHRNIVGMLGLCDTMVVTEYYTTSFLRAIFRGKMELPDLAVVSMALDAARGLQALHEIAGSIHVDLKPQQLLIDDDGRVMLNDFNSAHIMSISQAGDGMACPAQSTKRKLPTPWPSPENYAGEVCIPVEISTRSVVLHTHALIPHHPLDWCHLAPTLAGSKRFRDQPLTPASDIYSLAMIFFSLMAGSLPYEGNPELLARAMSRQGRPQIDPSWHKGFMKVVQDMWHQTPQKRPSAKRVVMRLQLIQAEIYLEAVQASQ